MWCVCVGGEMEQISGRMQGLGQVRIQKGRMGRGCGSQTPQKWKVHGGVEENDVWCGFFQEKRGEVIYSASATGKHDAFW